MLFPSTPKVGKRFSYSSLPFAKITEDDILGLYAAKFLKLRFGGVLLWKVGSLILMLGSGYYLINLPIVYSLLRPADLVVLLL